MNARRRGWSTIIGSSNTRRRSQDVEGVGGPFARDPGTRCHQRRRRFAARARRHAGRTGSPAHAEHLYQATGRLDVCGADQLLEDKASRPNSSIIQSDIPVKRRWLHRRSDQKDLGDVTDHGAPREEQLLWSRMITCGALQRSPRRSKID